MNLSEKHCVPCEKGTPSLTEAEEDTYFGTIAGWELVREKPHKIKKEFKFDKYLDGIDFVCKVGALSEAEGHHPDLHVYYKKVIIELSTHAVGGLSTNDFILAAKIDGLQGETV